MTHRKPLLSETVPVALENLGFRDTAIYFLTDGPNSWVAIPQSEFQLDPLSACVKAPPGFAVIARKR